jgi:hypothetical protein
MVEMMTHREKAKYLKEKLPQCTLFLIHIPQNFFGTDTAAPSKGST